MADLPWRDLPWVWDTPRRRVTTVTLVVLALLVGLRGARGREVAAWIVEVVDGRIVADRPHAAVTP